MEDQLFDVDNPFQVKLTPDGDFTRDSLVLADIYSEELESQNPRPFIVVDRETVAFDELGLDNRVELNVMTSETVRATVLTSGVIIRCYGRNSIECDNLAFAVAGVLMFFRKEIRNHFNIVKIGQPLVYPAQPKETDSVIRLFSADVRIPVQLPFKWTVTYSDLVEVEGFTVRLYWDADKNKPAFTTEE